VRIWDAVTGQETFALDKAHTDSIWSLGWDGRGVFLASGSSDGIRIWAPGGEDRHAPVASLPDLGARVYSVAWVESK
jgi:WD40 repeat protein